MTQVSGRRLARRRRILGASYGVVGVAAFAAALVSADLSSIDVSTLALLAVLVLAGAFLGLTSGEVNDRLWVSSHSMVVLAAGAFTALTTEQIEAVVLAMAVVGFVGFYTPGDWRKRLWYRSLSNAGQLVLASCAAGMTLAVVSNLARETIPDLLPAIDARTSAIARMALAGIAASLVYTLVNLALVRIGVRILHGRRAVDPWSSFRWVALSLVVMGVIGSFLGVLFALAEDPVVVPLTVIVFVVGQLVFTSMARLRAAHEAAISGFVKTLEARDLYTRGHTEKVAEFCQIAGEQLKLSEERLERLRWAALIHDVGKLAVGTELMASPDLFGEDERLEYHAATHRVDDLLSEVGFLRPMVEIASGFHPAQTNVDYGQMHHRHHQAEPTVEQCILAVADAFDAMTSSRSYRMAISQTAALEQLRRSTDPVFQERVVDALERGLVELGREYGPPDLEQEAAAHG